MPFITVRGYVFAFVLACFAMAAESAENPRNRGNLGVGVILGEPSGFTAKAWVGKVRAIDALAAWSFRDFFFMQSHYVFHSRKSLEDKEFWFYAGPGGYARLGVGKDRLGVSGNFGVAYAVRQFEVFLELSPKVSIVPDTDGDLTGGLGFHYYF